MKRKTTSKPKRVPLPIGPQRVERRVKTHRGVVYEYLPGSGWTVEQYIAWFTEEYARAYELLTLRMKEPIAPGAWRIELAHITEELRARYLCVVRAIPDKDRSNYAEQTECASTYLHLMTDENTRKQRPTMTVLGSLRGNIVKLGGQPSELPVIASPSPKVDKAPPSRKGMTEREAAVLTILESLKVNEALLAKNIVTELKRRFNISHTESALRSREIPALRKRGFNIQERKTVGYWIGG